MKKRRKDRFRKWFVKQFGNRVSVRTQESLMEEMDEAHRVYIRAKITYEKVVRWDEKFNDCLYAWQAAPPAKPALSGGKS